MNQDGQSTPPVGTFVSVSAGWLHTCGVKSTGAVACWGSNSDLDGTVVGQGTSPVGTFSSVSAGGDHSCGVLTNKNLTCWGADNQE